MKKCLEHLDELLTMPVAPLMFKKQPDIVTTIRKLRKYIGPEDDPVDKAMAQEWNGAAQKIRVKSDTVFHKIQVIMHSTSLQFYPILDKGSKEITDILTDFPSSDEFWFHLSHFLEKKRPF